MKLLQVSIEDNEMKTLKQLALDKDTNVSELVRQWVAQIVKSVEEGTK
jgi:hypothetical protein